MTATYTINAAKNGLEIRFDSKPAAAQKVAAWARQQGGRVWVDTTGDC